MTDTKEKAAGAESIVYAVPQDLRVSVGAPSLLVLPNGKWLVAFDQTGPDVKSLMGKKGHDAKRSRWMQGRVMASSDNGATWQLSAMFPFRRASLFRDGGDVYLLGEASGGLSLMRSPDGGGSWSAPMELTGDLDLWVAPTTLFSHGECWFFPVQMPSEGGMGMTVFRAPRGASLMSRKAWTQGPLSPPLSKWIPQGAVSGCGVPLGNAAPTWRDPVLASVATTNHPWHHANQAILFGATQCGRQHWSAIARLNLSDLTLTAQNDARGAPWTWLPLPGGHEKFNMFYDEPSRKYWLVGSRGAPGLPMGPAASGEEGLHRLGLWSSENLADWQGVATLVTGGEGAAGIRCDPAVAVSGQDLVWVCRAGGARTRNARETMQVTCGRLPNFRAHGY